MGNTPPSGTSFRLGNGDNSVEVRRGSGFVQVMEKSNGEITESWEVAYFIGWSSSGSFTLTKTKGNTKSPHHHGEKLEIKIKDSGREGYSDIHSNSSVIVEKAETGILGLSFRHFFDHMPLESRTYPCQLLVLLMHKVALLKRFLIFIVAKNGR